LYVVGVLTGVRWRKTFPSRNRHNLSSQTPNRICSPGPTFGNICPTWDIWNDRTRRTRPPECIWPALSRTATVRFWRRSSTRTTLPVWSCWKRNSVPAVGLASPTGHSTPTVRTAWRCRCRVGTWPSSWTRRCTWSVPCGTATRGNIKSIPVPTRARVVVIN